MEGRALAEAADLLRPATNGKGSPSTSSLPLHRSASDEDAKSNGNHAYGSTTPLASTSRTPMTDLAQSAFESARIKLSSRDREAMEKIRSTMSETSSSSPAASPLSSGFPISAGGPGSVGGIGVRPRRSTLALEHTGEKTPSMSKIGERMRRDGEVGGTSPPLANVDYVVAIVGHAGVGKSTVIRRATKAWGVSIPVSIESPGGLRVSSCFSQIKPGGNLRSSCKVEFLEMSIQSLDLSRGTPDIWPSFVAPISGVILCYDAGRLETFRGIKEILHLLAPTGIPMVLFATKSDPGAKLEVEAAYGNSISEPYNVGLIEVTMMDPEGKSKMRNGLRWLLYKLEQRQRRLLRKVTASQTTVSDDRQSSSPRMLAGQLSDVLSADSDTSTGSQLMWRHGKAPPGGNGDGRSSTQSSSSSLQWMMKGPIQSLTSNDQDEGVNASAGPEPAISVPAKSNEPMEVSQISSVEKEKVGQDISKTSAVEPLPYVSLTDLFNRLFTAMVSTLDDAYIAAFFLTYRRFCQPAELMTEFLNRFREVEMCGVSKDVRHWALQRLTGGLIDWTSKYPGDLQTQGTAAIFLELLSIILKYAFIAHLTVELVDIEQSLPDVVDVDASWSVKTKAPEPSERTVSTTELVLTGDVLYEFDQLSQDKLDSGKTPSMKSGTNSLSMSTSSLNVDRPESEVAASAMVPRKRSGSDPRIGDTSGLTTNSNSEGSKSVHSDDLSSGSGMGSSRWLQPVQCVLNYDPRYFATELTRMTWALFSVVRPRDVFRHDLGKEQSGPVGKSILFFNHLSRWVSTMILANPKPKHRARVYESFMLIALQLRRLNNYDSLYAVISGMKETSVHRLAQTHQLVRVAPHVEKDFQSHLKLMDPRSGYIHYRRALQADMSHGRPAIPLLMTALSLVSRLQVVRPNDRRSEDGLIQWDKFERFGEILSIIPECQSKGPPIPGPASIAFRQLIEDTPIIEHEDGLFERSKLLEPGGQNGTGSGNVLRRLVNLGI